jgi:hypothetical protein
LWRRLSGEDGPGRTALPAGELFHPAALAAIAALALNDHVLKGRGPAWLTGKLSDLAGVLFFPLLLTALLDTLAWLLARRRVDFTLRRWKIRAACAATAAGFAAPKLWPAVGHAYARLFAVFHVHVAFAPDRTDLVALLMLVPAWLIGRAELRRVPLGRLELMQRRGRTDLDDTGAPAELAEVVAAWLREPDDEARADAVTRGLAKLR